MSEKSMVEKELRPKAYARTSPGQICERCGGDNSYRKRGTKYCFKCSHEVSLENAQKRRDYIDKLMQRDKPGINPCCVSLLATQSIFCSICGQRLKKKEEQL